MVKTVKFLNIGSIKLRLNKKLSIVLYSSAINTYEYLLTCLREAAGDALDYLSNTRTIKCENCMVDSGYRGISSEDRRYYTRCRNEPKGL